MIRLSPLGRLPAWMVAVVMSREISVTALRAIASAEGKKVIEASALGKYKTIFQLIAISGLLIHFEDPLFHADFHNVGAVMFLVALFFTVWSGIDYFIEYWKAPIEKA
jgi:CDP-diacylglycerol--glycerol-3-phosphate 3-phosphatidyltransferase